MPEFTTGRTRPARFLLRRNRFLVECETEEEGRSLALLPNSGRLQELLIPGARLYLRDRRVALPEAEAAALRIPYSVLAVEREGVPVFVDTHDTNQVARFLLDNRRIPGLEDAEVVRAEVKCGHSRFDFLMRETGQEFYLEVKSVTLFGNGVAMFPDAVTERGRRHLIELSELDGKATRHAVLFLVHTPCAKWFIPDYHTDLAFAQTLLEVRDRLRIFPVSIRWNRGLRLGKSVRLLDIPWQAIEREARDRGAYLLILRLDRPQQIEIGALGPLQFSPGYYVYVGSALQNLSSRVARHLRKRKRFHWHIDYLRNLADHCTALPIRSSRRDECAIAGALGRLFSPGPRRFGSSDCQCATHLFHSTGNPLHTREFHALLQSFRMRKPHLDLKRA